ncbi:MAG: beta-1,6-N-acetylglucosaminyltransferase [Rikenellaceae bacterium]
MKFAYLILSYKNFEQLKRFISSIEGDGVRIYIHIDKKVYVSPQLREQLIALGGNISIVDDCDRVSVFWGGFSLVDAMIVTMHSYLSDDFVADYVHICTDSDDLIRPRAEMEQFMISKGLDRNYLTLYALPNEMWRDGGMGRFIYKWSYDYRSKFGAMLSVKIQKILGLRRKLPPTVEFYGGSSWMTLTHAAISYVSQQSVPSNEIFRHFRYVAIPDESYIHTLLMNSSRFRDSVEYNNLRYIKWSPPSPHPQILTPQDRDEWLASGQFIGRKFLPMPLSPKSWHERWGVIRSRVGNYFKHFGR